MGDDLTPPHWNGEPPIQGSYFQAMQEAAARIALLEEALRPFAQFAASFDKGGPPDLKRPGVAQYRNARTALSNGKGE